ncbi:MAG: hypothetical protein KGI28_05865 [Thaumarchaeota archaeon]|nr:hypothetical protein [Nitrososphaerota archaeon]
MNGKKILYSTIAFFVIAMIFYAGTMAMNLICTSNQADTHDPNWVDKSDLVCQLFTNLAQLIKQVTNQI